MSLILFTGLRGSARMPDYGNSSSTSTDVPRPAKPRPPTSGAGKVPEGPSKPLVGKVNTKIVVEGGRLRVVQKETKRQTA